MTLYHVSPRRNDRMIERVGLDPTRSTGAQRVVWLCSVSRILWALAHIAHHHKVDWRTLTIWRVSVKRRYLRRRRKGVWIDVSGEDIPATKLEWPSEVPLSVRRGETHGGA